MPRQVVTSCSALAALTLLIAWVPVVSGFQARGLVQNVRAAAASGGIEITYDLLAEDPRAAFAATLEMSDDGQAFAPVGGAVSGDVGAGVVAGLGKRILWRPSDGGKMPDLTRTTFRIVLGGATAAPGTSKPAGPGATGSVVVATVPSGASVSLNGSLKGETPLTLSELPVGNYALTVAKDGYLENRRDVTVAAGDPQTLTITLTRATAAAAAGTTSGGPQQATPPAGGGNRLKWILPLAGGGAAAGFLLTRKGNDPPIIEERLTSCTTLTTSPTTLNNFPSGGSTQQVTVTVGPAGCSGSVPWSASTGTTSWITLNPSSGSVTTVVSVTAPANTSAARTGTVTIAGRSYNVAQDGNPCSFTVRMRQGSNNFDNVGAGGGNREVEITASAQTCTWSASSDVAWITATPGNGTGNRTGTAAVVLAIGRNTTGVSRTGRVTVAGAVITLIQAGS